MDSKSSMKFGYVNIQSMRNKSLEVRELISENGYDILALSETWLKEFDKAVLQESTPATHNFFHKMREEVRGGGVGLFISKVFSHVKVVKGIDVFSFEYVHVNLKRNSVWLSFIVIYRPPRSSSGEFFMEFDNLLSRLDLTTYKTVICGDFNFWVENAEIINVVQLNEVLESYGLGNFITSPTSSTGHALDLIIGDTQSDNFRNINIEPVCTISPIHRIISLNILLPISKYKKKIFFRVKSDFSAESFIEDINSKILDEFSTNCDHDANILKADCVECYLATFNQIQRDTYDERCPLREKEIIINDRAPWFDGEIARKKKERRGAERKFCSLRSDSAKAEYISVKNQYNY